MTEETIQWQGHTLHRIEATRRSQWAKAGQKGGFVESEDNLKGEAWVTDDAKVWGKARVAGRALVGINAQVCDSATVDDDAFVGGNAIICGNARVYAGAWVRGNARVSD